MKFIMSYFELSSDSNILEDICYVKRLIAEEKKKGIKAREKLKLGRPQGK